jgi:hypothetical protein
MSTGMSLDTTWPIPAVAGKVPTDCCRSKHANTGTSAIWANAWPSVRLTGIDYAIRHGRAIANGQL